jgi:hypothetical protein
VPYCPRANGCVERFNKYVGRALQCFTAEHPRHWDIFCPTIAFNHNTAVVAPLGNTPFYVMHGFDPRIPYFPPRPIDPDKRLLPNQEEITAFVERQRNCFRYLRSLVLVKQLRAKAKSRELFKRKHKSTDFKVDDLVLIRFTTREKDKKKKLSLRWRGPYRVVERKNPVVFLVKHLHENNDKLYFIHAERMRPFVPGLDPSREGPRLRLYPDIDIDVSAILPATVPERFLSLSADLKSSADLPLAAKPLHRASSLRVLPEDTQDVKYLTEDVKLASTRTGRVVRTLDEELGYSVSEVLRKRFNPRANRTEYLVSWVGYSSKYNQWVPEEDLNAELLYHVEGLELEALVSARSRPRQRRRRRR